ncbi:hypothetical protein GB882_03460 [Georgenia ruanii]|uniref:Uncharacterized protein n=1 Tax=Georgenia ruanii TaxID=348442 RepID=A0A7J9UV54_9MICO|nr:hypothetical protein [Georgenia ruanii]
MPARARVARDAAATAPPPGAARRRRAAAPGRAPGRRSPAVHRPCARVPRRGRGATWGSRADRRPGPGGGPAVARSRATTAATAPPPRHARLR